MMSSPTVLIVEDEALVRMDIADELTARGFIVLEADSAHSAIALLERHPEIELLFTDIDMPGSMDGLMLANAVRDRWPPIKIIVTSGYRKIMDGDMPVGSVFFDKPYSADTIAGTMRDLIDA